MSMISKLIVYLAFTAFILTVGGFVLLAVWDVPVKQKVVETPIDISGSLQKAP